MMNTRAFIGLAILLLILSGCQTTGQAPREQDKQANNYLLQAQAYESEGNLVDALEQYKLAQTMDPDTPLVAESIQRVEQQLQQLAETHYQAGLRFRDKGKWELAKKEFLKALSYWPDHQPSVAMLQERNIEGQQQYVTHIIGPGESISKLALKYYGDYRKYHHIANFNNMTDATRVRVGQRIMIPVIEGVTIDMLNRINAGASASRPATAIEGDYIVHQIAPGESLSKLAQMYYGDFNKFRTIANYNGITDPTSVRVGQTIKIPRLAGHPVPASPPAGDTAYQPGTEQTATPATPEPSTPEAPPETVAEPTPEPIEPMDQVAEYRDSGIALFNEKNYDDAIVELNKVLSAAPDDDAAKRYLSRAWLEKGRQELDAGRIDDAKTALATALDYDSQCQDCNALLEACRSKESEALIADGEALYQRNQFEQAAAAIKRALAITPDNRRAKELLFQTHFQQALIQFNDKDYLAAKNGFEKALDVNPDCGECREYIDNSLNSYKTYHYNEGIVFFGREELKDAIAEWEKVEAIDPDYKDVKRNLEKARLLSERLERIKKGE
jgi:tetratricopeptide (TPR) repeat protein